MGLLPPLFLWVSGVLHHSLPCCLVAGGTKNDGILAFIGDAFSNLCHRFQGLAPKKLVLSKFRGSDDHMFGFGRDSLSECKYWEVPNFGFSFPFCSMKENGTFSAMIGWWFHRTWWL